MRTLKLLIILLITLNFAVLLIALLYPGSRRFDNHVLQVIRENSEEVSDITDIDTPIVLPVIGEPKVIIEKGEDGAPGAHGHKGLQGEKGDQGDPGQDGTDGLDGVNGVDGVDGIDGADGKTPEFQTLPNGLLLYRYIGEENWRPVPTAGL